MTALTLPTKHRSLWHFVPGLALTAALTGAALWPVVSRPSPARALAP